MNRTILGIEFILIDFTHIFRSQATADDTGSRWLPRPLPQSRFDQKASSCSRRGSSFSISKNAHLKSARVYL